MGQKCIICSGSKPSRRLKIDRAIVKGRSYTKIGLKYNVPMMSVRNHAKNHLSRQMLKSNEMQEVTHSKNLFEEVQELINRTKDILTKAEDSDKPAISLGAIRELRQTYEFLIKFSVYMEEAQKKQDKAGEYDDDMETARAIGNRLNFEERELLIKVIQKYHGKISQDVDLFEEIKKSWWTHTGRFMNTRSEDIDDDDYAVEDDVEDTKVIDVVVEKKKKKKSKLKKKSKKKLMRKKLKVEDDTGDGEDKVKHVSRRRRLSPKEMFPDADDYSINVL